MEKEDDKTGKGDTNKDDMGTFEGKFKVCTSKTPHDSGAPCNYLEPSR